MINGTEANLKLLKSGDSEPHAVAAILEVVEELRHIGLVHHDSGNMLNLEPDAMYHAYQLTTSGVAIQTICF